MTEFQGLPAAESYKRIDFDKVEVKSLPNSQSYILIVAGTKPYLNMRVDLVPRMYIKQPEYWGIEVVGSLHGVGLPTIANYSVFLPLDGIIGTEGIEVIGATKSEKRRVPP